MRKRQRQRQSSEVVVLGAGLAADRAARLLTEAGVAVIRLTPPVHRILWNAEGAIVEHHDGVVLGGFLVMAVPQTEVELFDWEPVLPVARSGPIGVVHWAFTEDDAVRAVEDVLARR